MRSNEGCPKCAGHIEGGYGLGFGPGMGAYSFCTVCEWHEKCCDPEGLTEEQARDEDRRIKLYNARIDRSCDRKRGLQLHDRVYEKRHRLEPGAMASKERLRSGCGVVDLPPEGAHG